MNTEPIIAPKAALLIELTHAPGSCTDLIDRLATHSKGAIRLVQHHTYPILRGMERAGLLRSTEVFENVEERGGRPRIVYQLTGRGKAQAQACAKAIETLFRW